MLNLLSDTGLVYSDFELIMNENANQLDKWGIQTHDVFQWLAFITEELGELSQAISEHHYRGGAPKNISKEAIQVATLALKMAVMIKEQMRGKKEEEI